MGMSYRLLDPPAPRPVGAGRVKRKRRYKRTRKQVPGTPVVVGDGTPGLWTTTKSTKTKRFRKDGGAWRTVRVRKVRRVRTIR